MAPSNRSLLSGHYPVITFRDGVRYLWNPVSRALMYDRPEERVRLRCIEFLLRESTISSAHISTEKGVTSQKHHGRTDILCYDKELTPLLLIECKSENVPLSLAAAEQSARYNTHIKAPWVLLTNGINDALYHVSGSLQQVSPSDMPYFPSLFRDFTDTRTTYWINHGFLPDELPEHHAQTLAFRISSLFQNPKRSVIRLPVSMPGYSEPWHHYFALLSHGYFPSARIALSFIKTASSKAELLASGRPGGQTIRIPLSRDNEPEHEVWKVLLNSDPDFPFHETLFECLHPVLFKGSA